MPATKEKSDPKKFDGVKLFDKVLDVLYIIQSILSITLPILNAIFEGLKSGDIGKGRRKDVEKDLKKLPETIVMAFGLRKGEKDKPNKGD